MGNEEEEGRLTTISCRGAAVAMDLQLLYGDSPSPLRLTTIRRSAAAPPPAMEEKGRSFLQGILV
jgi:hypothetical protein